MCERLGNFWSLHRIYIAFSNVVFSRAMDKIELKMKQSSEHLLRSLNVNSVECFYWASKKHWALMMQFFSLESKNFSQTRVMLPKLLGRLKQVFVSQLILSETLKTKENVMRRLKIKRRYRHNHRNYDEVDHTIWWWGDVFRGILLSNVQRSAQRMQRPMFRFLHFFWPILRCSIFMCFKVCYKLNKNHTRKKQRRRNSS